MKYMLNLGLNQNQALHWMPSVLWRYSARVPSALDGYGHYVSMPLVIGPSCHGGVSGVQYDVVLADGRARPQCAFMALSLIRPGGVLVIHDWERARYHIVLRWFDLLHTERFLAVFRKKETYMPKEENFPSWWRMTQSYDDPIVFDEPFAQATYVGI
jgi:hypothetical protein